LWCNTYQPAGGRVDDYSANFSLDRAVFRRVDNDIESETEDYHCSGRRRRNPENDTDQSFTPARHLDLTSYIELSMAPHNADRQHPAFNKLFIQTEAVTGVRSLLAPQTVPPGERSSDVGRASASHLMKMTSNPSRF